MEDNEAMESEAIFTRVGFVKSDVYVNKYNRSHANGIEEGMFRNTVDDRCREEGGGFQVYVTGLNELLGTAWGDGLRAAYNSGG